MSRDRPDVSLAMARAQNFLAGGNNRTAHLCTLFPERRLVALHAELPRRRDLRRVPPAVRPDLPGFPLNFATSEIRRSCHASS